MLTHHHSEIYAFGPVPSDLTRIKVTESGMVPCIEGM